MLPGARGCGVAGRALGAMGDWLFGEIGLHRLEPLHATGNPASCRVALRAGHAAEGTRLRQAVHADGWHAHARLRA